MKTKNNKLVKKIIIGFLVGAAILIAIPFCVGMYAGITSHNDTTGMVSKTLKEHCNCEGIEVDYSAYGLQFNEENGFTGETAAYILKDCKLNQSVKNEANRLNDILVTNVEGYKELDVVYLNFMNGNHNEQVVIKKGKLQ